MVKVGDYLKFIKESTMTEDSWDKFIVAYYLILTVDDNEIQVIRFPGTPLCETVKDDSLGKVYNYDEIAKKCVILKLPENEVKKYNKEALYERNGYLCSKIAALVYEWENNNAEFSYPDYYYNGKYYLKRRKSK